MALLAADRILEMSTTTGTGAYTLAGSVTGFRTFASIAGIAIGDTIDVAVHGFDGLGAPTAQFETGTYTYSAANTLTRTVVRESSAGYGVPVNWAAMSGTRQIAGSFLSYDLVRLRGLILPPRNPYAPDTYSLTPLPPGVGRQDATPFGGIIQAFARAQNMLSAAVSANVFLSDKAINSMRPVYVDAINNSATSDQFGPYVPANMTAKVTVGIVRQVQALGNDDVFTLLILVRSKEGAGLGSIELFDDETGRSPSWMLNAANPGGNALTFTASKLEPQYYYVSFKRSNAGAPIVQYNVKSQYLDIYGMWAVEGPVPVVTSRDKDRAKFIGPPAYMTGDYVFSQVAEGQQYLAVIAGTTTLLRKRAIPGSLVFKWPALTKHRLYEIVNNTDFPVRVMLPVGASGPLAYDAAVGGEVYANENGGGSALAVALTTAVNGERMTFCMRNSAGYDQGRIRIAGNGVTLYLQADLVTWSTTAVQLSGADGTKYPATIAITFTMPTGTQATSLGSSPTVAFEYFGPNYNATPGYLARGESACI